MKKIFLALPFFMAIAAAGCKPISGYSCAAYCVSEFECSSDGDSKWAMKLLTGEGPTAASAYQQLAEACPQGGSRLVANARCLDGKLEVAPAPLASSCGHN